MERAIDPLLTIDAKLWADEFMATKQRLGDAEFDHAMMLGWFANAIMRGYDAGRDLMMPTLSSPDAQATIAALQADNRTYINERHEHMKQIEQLQAMNNRLGVRVETLESQLTQRTAELEAAKADRGWRGDMEDTGQLRLLTAACAAHRVCCGEEADSSNGKIHGYCVVCGVPWPCGTAAIFMDAVRYADR